MLVQYAVWEAVQRMLVGGQTVLQMKDRHRKHSQEGQMYRSAAQSAPKTFTAARTFASCRATTSFILPVSIRGC